MSVHTLIRSVVPNTTDAIFTYCSGDLVSAEYSRNDAQRERVSPEDFQYRFLKRHNATEVTLNLSTLTFTEENDDPVIEKLLNDARIAKRAAEVAPGCAMTFTTND